MFVEIDTSDQDKLDFEVNMTEDELVAELNDMDKLMVKFPLFSGHTYVSKLHIVSVHIPAAKQEGGE